MRAGGTGLRGGQLAGAGIAEGDAVVGVGKVFCGEPPWDGVALHAFEDEAGGERRSVALHHLVMKAADGLDLTERPGIVGVGVAEVEVVGAPGLSVGVGVVGGGDGEKSVGLVIHEVASNLVGAVGEAGRVLVVGGLEKDDGGVDGTGAESYDVAFVGGGRRAIGVLDFYGSNSGSGGVGEETKDARVGEERDVGETHDLADAVDVRIGFGVDETGVAIAGVTADTLAGCGIEGVAFEAEGDGEGVDAELADVGFDGGHAGFA